MYISGNDRSTKKHKYITYLNIAVKNLLNIINSNMACID